MYLVTGYTLSQLLKQNPDLNVMHHLHQHHNELVMAVTVWQELQFSFELMPNSQRKTALSTGFFEQLEKLPFLNYDKKCAEIHAKICAIYQREGRSLLVNVSQEASIALAHDLTLVTHIPESFDLIENLKIANWFE